eukprot:scaffold82713_cov43-Prasinocladus_malaysianus.AAC.1
MVPIDLWQGQGVGAVDVASEEDSIQEEREPQPDWEGCPVEEVILIAQVCVAEQSVRVQTLAGKR